MTGNIESIVSQMLSVIPLGRVCVFHVCWGAMVDSYEESLETTLQMPQRGCEELFR